PATVGGAVYTNAGTSAGDMSGVVHRILICDRSGRQIWTEYSTFSPRYRNSGIPEGWAVLGAEFTLKRTSPGAVRDEVERYRRRRRERQPQGVPCAGSIFKNPPSRYAARLIEELGLKGASVGGAKVSDVHANFIINEGASSADVLALIRMVKDRVRSEFGIELELEIELWGFVETDEP
ncbi:MAG TPA: UDP-N-acetylenolpyruvoylglucosamine reductase, partial [Proteobacteria bacterium]|nr:UDP-N-acetylenolpyruvoylglucosamine reductase [Pseudomonadota bacterium]